MDIDYVDVFFGAAIALLLAEGCAWLPKLTRRIIRFAAARLSSSLSSRLEEEWLRHVSDLPGAFSPFFAACACLLASFRISPVKLGFGVPARKVRAFRLLQAFLKSFLPKRVQLSGSNAHHPAFTVRLAWIVAIAIGVALAFAALISAIEALQRLVQAEPLQASALTRAHRKLPLGTKLRVTNMANGRSVIVRLNERTGGSNLPSVAASDAEYYGYELALHRSPIDGRRVTG